MNVLYLDLSSEVSKHSGRKKKVYSQIKALESLGVSVLLLDSYTALSNRRGFANGAGILQTLLRRKQLISKCRELIKLKKIDIVYMRYPCGDPLVASFVQRFGNYIITEHQTIESVELKGRKRLSLIKTYFENLYGPKILRRVAGIVGVTTQITEYEVSRSTESKPHLVNGNGIDVASVPLRTPAEFNRKDLEILCVAQVAKWHGLDRLIKGMAEYKGNVNVRLHIVGDGSEVPNLKKLVSNLKLESSVVFYGFKTGKELDELFDKCHIAVGSLGLHRIGVSEGSILKVREYCTRGIPFIYGAMDSDFNEEFPYILRVPPDESPIDLNAVFSFAAVALSDTEHSVKMREYAEENLDWSIKMKKLIDFMNEILESKVRR